MSFMLFHRLINNLTSKKGGAMTSVNSGTRSRTSTAIRVCWAIVCFLLGAAVLAVGVYLPLSRDYRSVTISFLGVVSLVFFLLGIKLLVDALNGWDEAPKEKEGDHNQACQYWIAKRIKQKAAGRGLLAPQ